MSKTIRLVAKILGLSIIFAIIFNASVYIIQLKTLDNRVSAIVDSMESVVSQQNYLPESAKWYYMDTLNQIQDDMGRDFFVSWKINHSGMGGHISSDSDRHLLNVGGMIENSDLAVVGSFGTVKVIDIIIEVRPPMLGLGSNVIHFTSAIPCQQYHKVN